MVFMANKSDSTANILFMNYKLFGYFLIALLFPLSNNYSQETILKKEIVLKMLDSVDSHNQISFEMFPKRKR